MIIETIKSQVIEILEDICSEKITETSIQLLNDLSLDSLSMVMLLVMIEDTFEIELDESDMNPFALITVQDVIDLVERYKIKSEEKEDA